MKTRDLTSNWATLENHNRENHDKERDLGESYMQA